MSWKIRELRFGDLFKKVRQVPSEKEGKVISFTRIIKDGEVTEYVNLKLNYEKAPVQYPLVKGLLWEVWVE